MSNIGVAISTTGQEHRIGFLETTVKAWRAAFDGPLFVTVDGWGSDLLRVQRAVGELAEIYKVGHPSGPSENRLGVAANKNTGLELLMDSVVEHLFLSDDDAWPLSNKSLEQHLNLGLPHSSVCWGAHKKSSIQDSYSEWSWPRGSVLYVARSAVETVGGFIEAFGVGGHEHVEWSRRFRIMGLTPHDYCAPVGYAGTGPDGREAMGARHFWYCEDMPLPGEPLGSLVSRRRRITSVQRSPADIKKQEWIMTDMESNPRFIPYRASANDRTSATLCTTTKQRELSKMSEPRSQS